MAPAGIVPIMPRDGTGPSAPGAVPGGGGMPPTAVPAPGMGGGRLPIIITPGAPPSAAAGCKPGRAATSPDRVTGMALTPESGAARPPGLPSCWPGLPAPAGGLPLAATGGRLPTAGGRLPGGAVGGLPDVRARPGVIILARAAALWLPARPGGNGCSSTRPGGLAPGTPAPGLTRPGGCAAPRAAAGGGPALSLAGSDERYFSMMLELLRENLTPPTTALSWAGVMAAAAADSAAAC
mmetsp:Transcript_111481/g.310446  ORF Transcript_111481/g.310446 Transcript_111481/m.310446 type:complete len:238 (-) Transcript_111481:520-1233(-)